jgi:V8-like Glu-specific endopeptidase
VEIIGYPSKGYAKINNLLSVNLNRSHLKGRIVSIEDITINHKLLTKVGHSGSPILYKAANNKIAAIGIHTHRGNAHENRGLYFNEKVIKIIKKFEI